MSVLRWRHDRRRIVLPVIILRPEPVDLTQVGALALVDTGATTSGIVQRIANELGLAPAGKRPMHIARGVQQVERYVFRVGLASTGDLGQPIFSFVFEETLGFELSDTTSLPDGRRLDAVVGMDVLSRCDFRLGRDGWCELTFA